MPEATVNKYDYAMRAKGKIGLAEQRRVPSPTFHVIAAKNRGESRFGHFVAG